MHSIIGQRTLCGVFGAMTLFAALSTGYVSASQERWQLTMNNAELRDVVEEISSILGKTVILDPKVQGRITVMSSQALDREGVRRLFYSVLDTHGFRVLANRAASIARKTPPTSGIRNARRCQYQRPRVCCRLQRSPFTMPASTTNSTSP